MPFEDTISGDSSGFLIVISGIVILLGICLCCGSCCRNIPEEEETPASNVETQINWVHRKYQKGVGLVLVGDGTCAVCLGEYFRTLPDCSHSFHVQCIDMWLYSQPSCLVCRANATPVTLVAKQ
ncbi:hypothetical protein ACFX13_042033 [Malus domestica]